MHTPYRVLCLFSSTLPHVFPCFRRVFLCVSAIQNPFYHEFPVGSPLCCTCICCGLTVPSVVRYTVRSFVYFTTRFPLPSPYIRCVPLHSPWVFLWVPRALRYAEPVRFTVSSLWVPRDNSCAFAVFPCVSPCVSPLVPSGFPAIFPLHSPCVSFRFPWVPSRVPCASHYTESPRFTMFMFPVGSPLSFLYILPVFLFVFPLHLPCVSFRFPWVPPRVPRASHYGTPRFTMCSPWVTRYLSCTFVVCSLAFPVSSDICFLYILLYITPEFRHEFPVVSPLSLFTFSMCSVSFAVYSVLCSRYVSLYGICAFHHIPTTFPINSPCVPLRFSCVTPSVPRLFF